MLRKACLNYLSSKVSRLDRLVNVAGVMLPKRQETEEGLEKTLVIGHLSAFVLCQTLVPSLASATDARILNVSGAPKHILKHTVDFANIDRRLNYSGIAAAIGAVHAKTVMTQILAAKLTKENITVNSFHPGLVRSNLGRALPAYLRILFRLASPLMSPVSVSGNYVSTSPAVSEITGQLFVKTTPRALNFDTGYQEQIWDWTVKTVQEALAT